MSVMSVMSVVMSIIRSIVPSSIMGTLPASCFMAAMFVVTHLLTCRRVYRLATFPKHTKDVIRAVAALRLALRFGLETVDDGMVPLFLFSTRMPT